MTKQTQENPLFCVSQNVFEEEKIIEMFQKSSNYTRNLNVFGLSNLWLFDWNKTVTLLSNKIEHRRINKMF